MIINFEIFENSESYKDINSGEYVILNINDHYLFHHFTDIDNRKFLKYINSTIGEISIILRTNKVIITYDNIPKHVRQFFKYDNSNKYNMTFNVDDIKYHSSNKDDVESYLQAKKYNL